MTKSCNKLFSNLPQLCFECCRCLPFPQINYDKLTPKVYCKECGDQRDKEQRKEAVLRQWIKELSTHEIPVLVTCIRCATLVLVKRNKIPLYCEKCREIRKHNQFIAFIGGTNSCLGMHPYPRFDIEHKKILREMVNMRLKPKGVLYEH